VLTNLRIARSERALAVRAALMVATLVAAVALDLTAVAAFDAALGR
jgi:hypothetical protein